MEPLDTPPAGVAGLRRIKTRRGLVAAAVTASVASFLLVAGPAAASPEESLGGGSPAGEERAPSEREGDSPGATAPRIARVRCVRQCPTPGAVAPGGRVRVVGSGLGRVSSVVFHGAPGAADDARVGARPRSDRSVVVAVPKRAVTGSVSAIARGGRSAPSRPVVIASGQAPAPEANADDNDVDVPASGSPAPSGRRFVFPVKGSFTLGEAGARFGASRGGRSHQGQDVIAACGTPLVAAAAGVVSVNRNHGLAGNYLVIDGSGYDTVYMHLAAPSPLAVGTQVRAGQPIGTVGATGNARGCHLHFEAWTEPGYQKGGAPVDPLPLLRGGG